MNQLATRAWVTTVNRYRQLRRDADERGLTTTEIAVLTFVLVAAAVAIGAILFNYAKGQAEALPEDPTVEFETGTTADD